MSPKLPLHRQGILRKRKGELQAGKLERVE